VSKLGWNKFIDTYNKRIAFTAVVSTRLPKGLSFDKNGRKLPTPYGLFCEWCAAYLTGDWTTTKVKSGIVVCVATNKDEEIIKEEFSIIGTAKVTIASKNTFPIGYRNSQYAALAGDLGYVF